jgi:hypothetical protein
MIGSFFILSMMSASAAAAQPANEALPAPMAKPVKEKKICRESDDSTSRLARRICRTAKEWDESRTNAKAGVRRVNGED